MPNQRLNPQRRPDDVLGRHDLSGEILAEGQAPELGFPGTGIPGGIAFETEMGIALRDAETGDVARTLGTEAGFTIDATSENLAWCEGTCEELHITDLDGEDSVVQPPSGSGTFDSWSGRFSPDGELLAVYVESSVVLVNVRTGSARVVSEMGEALGPSVYPSNREGVCGFSF